MRVVLDTNVIIAAFAARGLCAEVLEVCISGHTIILSDQIFLEVKKYLINKVRLPKATARAIIEYLRGISEIVVPEQVPEDICRDVDDLRIIGAALSGRAPVIITGDDDLLTIKKYKGVSILTPREFWALLKSN